MGVRYFGKFRLDAGERQLWCENEQIALTPKQFDLLEYFVDNAGRTTKKSELLDAIWADTFVEETTLARNISWLRDKLAVGSDGQTFIQTVPKVGYRFTADVRESCFTETDLIIEEQVVQQVRTQETITISDARKETTASSSWIRLFASPWFAVVSLLLIACVGSGFAIYSNYYGGGNNSMRGIASVPPRQSNNAPIKIGSVVNLQNRYPNDGSYLDAWGAVWSKPEFKQIPTETMFVSTHNEPNRENGSGSWEIVSATAKNVGEQLVVGDRVHIRNMQPNAGYLDACGWTEHLPVFEKFLDQSGAVFTTRSPNRDNGTGIWIIRSATMAEGTPIFEGDNIAIESSYYINDRGTNRVSGFLNVAGKVADIPAFSDYQGSKLVFTKNISFDQPIPDIWTILVSRFNSNEK
ncbi:MAG: winged helix-turn-helix domain-containing protein [Blastocatellia bacterium]|nr:winged helix-turn-helix domain-containing protein [Blastocatellia bacterium]